MALISLAPDDLPTCPQHGIRIITDFITDEDGTEYEMGTCPLCKRVYKFVVEEDSLTEKARSLANEIFGYKGDKA